MYIFQNKINYRFIQKKIKRLILIKIAIIICLLLIRIKVGMQRLIFIDQDYHSEYNNVHRIKTFANYLEDWNGNTLFPLYFVTNSKQDLLKDLEDTKILSELKVDGDITTSDFFYRSD